MSFRQCDFDLTFDVMRNLPPGDDAFCAGQNFLRVDALCRVAFEPGHFAVLFFREPVLKLFRACGRIGGGETAVVKAQFQRALSDFFFHHRLDVASRNWWTTCCATSRTERNSVFTQHVGLLVKWFARGEQFADFFLRIGVVEQGTVRLVFDALPDFFRRRPEADDQRVRLEAGEVFRIRRQAAAGGDDRLRRGRQVPRPASSSSARKAGSPSVLKMSAMVRPVPRLDHFVRVEIIEMQLLGDEPAHGGLARAHEADEREIDDAAVALHGEV